MFTLKAFKLLQPSLTGQKAITISSSLSTKWNVSDSKQQTHIPQTKKETDKQDMIHSRLTPRHDRFPLKILTWHSFMASDHNIPLLIKTMRNISQTITIKQSPQHKWDDLGQILWICSSFQQITSLQSSSQPAMWKYSVHYMIRVNNS